MDRQQTEVAAGLAAAVRSLNDVVTELACGLATGEQPTKGYAYTVVQSLAEHTRHLGGTPSLDVDAIPDWKDHE